VNRVFQGDYVASWIYSSQNLQRSESEVYSIHDGAMTASASVSRLKTKQEAKQNKQRESRQDDDWIVAGMNSHSNKSLLVIRCILLFPNRVKYGKANGVAIFFNCT
jgi:hypothetical protein